MDNEGLAFYTNPLSLARGRDVSLLQLVKENGYERPEVFVLGILQQRMRGLLEALLNGYDYGLDGRDPSPRNCFTSNYVGLEDHLYLVTTLQAAGVHGLELVTDQLHQMRSYSTSIPISQLASTVASFYASLPEIIKFLQPALHKTEVAHPPSLDPAIYSQTDSSYRRIVLELSDYVTKRISWAVKGFYLHGSLSTLDYIRESSDCDTFAIIKRDVASSATSLLELRATFVPVYKIFYRIDPLQHHGVMLVSEQDMDFYPQAFFPLVLLKYANTLWSDGGPLVFHERDSTFERRNVFLLFVNNFRWRFLHQTPFENLFVLKLYLQALLLFPALYYQAQGLYDYKKFSFPRLYEELDPLSLNIITKATTIRNENMYGVQQSLLLDMLLAFRNLVPGWVPAFHFMVRRIQPSSRLIEFLGEDWLREISDLADILLERCRRGWEC